MKYKRLSSDELKELEKEFIHFLATNSIPADDWERMKKNNTEKVDEYIDLFSDMVMDKALQQIKYLEISTPTSVMYFKCDKDALNMVSLVSEDDSVDFTNKETMKRLGTDPSFVAEGKFKTLKRQKDYSTQRELDIFQMTTQGCLVSDGRVFELLSSLNNE